MAEQEETPTVESEMQHRIVLEAPPVPEPSTVDQSDELNELFAALAEAQKEITNAEADQDNDFLNSKYASLAAVFNTIRKPLADQGLAILQFPVHSDDKAVALLDTYLTHKSGQYMVTRWSMPLKDNQPQTIGTVMTYMRRYSVSAITAVAQWDDDAQSAQKGADEYDRISPKEADAILIKADELFGATDEGGKADSVVGRMLEKIFSTKDNIIDRVADIPAGQHEQALKLLENQHKRESEANGGPKKEAKADEEKPAKPADKKPPKDKS